ncbi:MAG: adhesin, partial [Pseudoalteromonas nigrifaciens]
MKQYTLTRSALCVSLALTTTSAFAANSWLSRVNTVSEDQQQQIHVANYVESLSSIDARDTSQAVFDITVSLYNNPQGNEKLIYDQVFANFADAVCEQSNGEHKLGKISVFRENKHRSKSDIIWGPREWPRANASGFGANGMHIWFGDIFPNGAGAGLDHNMLQDPVGAGYTLAHEWGHYAYGVFDEYRGSAESGQASTPLS